MRSITVTVAFVVLLSSPWSTVHATEVQQLPIIIDFENQGPGQTPDGWLVPEPSLEAGYTAVITEEGAHDGRRCVLISGPGSPGAYGNVMRHVDATRSRGKIIRLRAAVRTEAEGWNGLSQLWLRVDRPGGTMGFFDNMGDRPIADHEWKEYEIVGPVAEDAESISFGCIVQGKGRVWLDSVTIAAVDRPETEVQPPRELTDRGLTNLVALTRLLGYVRYFHPSDEAAGADWEDVAIRGVRTVEGAPDAASLAAALTELILPLAPAVRVVRSDEPIPDVERAGSSAEGNLRTLTWRHVGVGTGSTGSIYSSERIDQSWSARSEYCALAQSVGATTLRATTIRLRGAVRSHLAEEEHRAGLWLRVDRENGPPILIDSREDRQEMGGTWQEHALEAEIPDDATTLWVGALLAGEGKIAVDDLRLELVEPAESEPPALTNPGFEQVMTRQGIELPEDWGADDPRSWPFIGYSTSVTRDGVHRGERSAVIESVPMPALVIPDPAEPFIADLGGGVHCAVPLAVYADDEGTLPRATEPLPMPLPGYSRTQDDRATRLASVALAWNVFQHFFPYFDVVETDWPEALKTALRTAATDADPDAFHTTLRRLVAALHDGHGNVWHPGAGAHKALPLSWEWVEDRLVITAVSEELADRLAPGDVVTAIDAKDPAGLIIEREKTISSATPQWARQKAVSGLRWLKIGERVVLTVDRGSGVSADIELEGTLDEPIEEGRSDPIAELKPGVLYVDLGRISDTDFEQALPRLETAHGLIFDLRGYPRLSTVVLSHLTDEIITCAQWWIPVVMRPDRADMRFEFSNWEVSPAKPRLRAKAAFLTDGRAISYAETYLGIVEHYQLAEIVGSATAGTNGNVNPFTLPGGIRVMWTGMKVLKQDGSRHHGVGILPTIPMERTVAGIRAGRDEVLERAVAAVTGDAPKP